MLRPILALIALLSLAATPAMSADAPRGVAGFVLGANIGELHGKLRMETTLPIRYAEFLKEVEAKQVPGFKSVLITYADCEKPPSILRIKAKYSDFRREFFDKLLDKFEQRFGKPDRWRGDPFHVVVAWKWSFIDESGHRIGLTLQHNTQDASESIGNVVKLRDYDLEQEHFECFERKRPDESKPDREHAEPLKDIEDWTPLLPK